MSRRVPSPKVGARKCGFVTPREQMSAHDRREMDKFAQFLTVAKSRKEGADPSACDLLEAAIYPEGIGRKPAGEVDA